jgi:hypothetical protein
MLVRLIRGAHRAHHQLIVVQHFDEELKARVPTKQPADHP